MKQLLSELRLYFAELLLGWASDIAPGNEEGKKIQKHILEYFAFINREIKVPRPGNLDGLGFCQCPKQPIRLTDNFICPNCGKRTH